VSRAARCPKHAEQVAAGHTDPPACKGCDKAEALAELRALLPPGSTVYTILRSVSRSGMSRELSVVAFKDGRALHPNWAVAQVTDYRPIGADGGTP
jgi:hypothetical protein